MREIPVAELPDHLMAVRHGDTVHAIGRESSTPECGDATVTATRPEYTGDPVDCWRCVSIVG